MENASKALLIAAGVLVGILVMSLGVYLFMDFGSQTAEVNKQNEQKQLSAFNSQFTSYAAYKDKDDNWKITIYDIITLRGKAKENNEKYEDNQDKIDVIISGKGSVVNNYSDTELISMYSNSNGTLTKFSCGDIQYHAENGKVSSITFTAL